jgi:hypothetical protein
LGEFGDGINNVVFCSFIAQGLIGEYLLKPIRDFQRCTSQFDSLSSRRTTIVTRRPAITRSMGSSRIGRSGAGVGSAAFYVLR